MGTPSGSRIVPTRVTRRTGATGMFEEQDMTTTESIPRAGIQNRPRRAFMASLEAKSEIRADRAQRLIASNGLIGRPSQNIESLGAVRVHVRRSLHGDHTAVS